MMNKQTMQRLLEVFAVFAKLGMISFGGPAAHIALMEREFVQKRKWLDRQAFLDDVSLSQLIPGPNSTELAMQVGFRRAGWYGLFVAGISFIVPAMLLVAVFAYFYERYAALPALQSMMMGIQPVIVMMIAHAVWSLATNTLKNKTLIAFAILATIALIFGTNELLVLALTGVAYYLWQTWRQRRARLHSSVTSFVLLSSVIALQELPLKQLFWSFLKIGAVLYGSGYVLIAFLQSEFVERLGVLTEQQLLDAVTIGQFTPGPLFTTATFIGYLTNGFAGAWLATLAIFLPAFLFVALIAPIKEKLRQQRVLGLLLDGINCASLAFLFTVALTFFIDLTGDWRQLFMALISGVLLFRFSWNSAWFILGGAGIGLIMF